MRFIDTHCHFDFPPFLDDEPDSLVQAQQAGVSAIIVPAVSAGYFERIQALTERYPALYGALGLHPLYIEQHTETHLAELESLLQRRSKKIVAVGEIGLDLFMNSPHIDKQQWLLEQQLALAKKYDLPVILHSRRTHDQLAKILRQANLPRTGVIHGFSGSLEQANVFRRLGYFLGVGGVITYPRAQKTRRTFAALPADALLLETDAPDMPLNGYQGMANRPERVAEVFTTLCELKPDEEPLQMREQIYLNSRALFRLP